MKELLSEHLGEIALLIYILYPLFKRWRDRQKKKREQAGAPAETTARAPAPKEPRRSPPSRQPSRGPGPILADLITKRGAGPLRRRVLIYGRRKS